MKYVIGIDIGGTNTKIGTVSENGTIHYRKQITTLTNCDIEIFIDALSAEISNAMTSMPKESVLEGIGIGAPNGNFYTGAVENAPNLGWGNNVPLVAMLQARFNNITATLTNDANAAAVGEMLFGAAQGYSDFIMITLGTGLGSGIVVNGQLVLGYDGMAGELGHITVKPNGRECGCGFHGCLETYCSATGLVRTTLELLSIRRADSPLRNVAISQLDAKMVYDAAIEGDEIAIEAFEKTGEILGTAMADMVAFSSPQAFFLFGGLAASGGLLLQPTQKALDENKRKIYSRSIPIIPSKLSGSDVAILGAAAVVLNQISKNK